MRLVEWPGNEASDEKYHVNYHLLAEVCWSVQLTLSLYFFAHSASLSSSSFFNLAYRLKRWTKSMQMFTERNAPGESIDIIHWIGQFIANDHQFFLTFSFSFSCHHRPFSLHEPLYNMNKRTCSFLMEYVRDTESDSGCVQRKVCTLK